MGRAVADGRLADWPVKARKIGDIVNTIGNWAAKWAAGSPAKGAAVGAKIAARGSEAHQVVYKVGKFLGVKFRPGGAVKIAGFIGNAGRVIAVVGGVLAVVAQIAEERQQEQCRRQLQEARDRVRAAYRDAALAVEEAFRAQFDAFLDDFYGSELEAIDEAAESLTSSKAQRSSEAALFSGLAQRAGKLIARIQLAAASGLPGTAPAVPRHSSEAPVSPA
jgi:hypothetical protein